jgi:hypothetical protein
MESDMLIVGGWLVGWRFGSGSCSWLEGSSSITGYPSEWKERTPQDSNWAPAKVENWKVRVDNDVPSDEDPLNINEKKKRKEKPIKETVQILLQMSTHPNPSQR